MARPAPSRKVNGRAALVWLPPKPGRAWMLGWRGQGGLSRLLSHHSVRSANLLDGRRLSHDWWPRNMGDDLSKDDFSKQIRAACQPFRTNSNVETGKSRRYGSARPYRSQHSWRPPTSWPQGRSTPTREPPRTQMRGCLVPLPSLPLVAPDRMPGTLGEGMRRDV
jgi:hypothetical protein